MIRAFTDSAKESGLHLVANDRRVKVFKQRDQRVGPAQCTMWERPVPRCQPEGSCNESGRRWPCINDDSGSWHGEVGIDARDIQEAESRGLPSH